jgi:hypothetical protein
MRAAIRQIVLAPRRYLLANRSDVAAAYSFRLLSPTYSGPLVRVRRSSDNDERDFYATQRVGKSKFVSWTEICAFAGSGTPFGTKKYDQSGLGRNLAQSTASAQPQVILAANRLPALLADGVDDVMATEAFTVSQPFSFNIVYRRVANAQTSYMNLFSGGSIETTLYHSLAGAVPEGARDNNLYAGTQMTGDNGVSQPLGTRGAVGGTFNGASSLLEVDAATVASFTGNPGTNGLNGITLFTNFNKSSSRFDNAEAQDLIVFNTGHTSAQLKADNAAMRRDWRF